MSKDSGMTALLKQRQEQLEKQLKELEKRENELKKNIEENKKKELEALKAEKDKIQKEQKEILKQLESEHKKEIEKKAVEEIAQSTLNIQKSIAEKNTSQTVGIATKLEVNHTLNTDPVTIGAIGVAAGAVYISNKVAEFKEKLSEKDAGKEWKKDIQERQDKLKEKHERQSQILAQNHVMQESQLKDAKKEGYEAKLVQLEKAIKQEKDKIDKKFEQEKKELNAEREKLEKIEKEFHQKTEAIKAEQQKTAEQKEKEQKELEKARQEEIERQRKEAERERQMELSR